ncbi:MAG: alpha-galactosidase, partial [Verrucomicrobiota bacterium]
GGGLVVAVGWTGQWQVSFARDGGTNVTVRVGMEDFRLRLHPGERMRTPGVLTLSYAGDWMDGQRQFRRLLLDHFTPRPGGRPVVPPVAASGATLGFNNVTAANQVQAITHLVRQRLPVDTYWVDAGWEAGGFPLGQGNHRPDPVRFPDGLGPVGRCARTNGLRFLLWFEPERVMPGTWLRTHHADWLLTPAGMPPEYAYQQRDGWRLLNLGHPEALAWAQAHFSRLVAEWGVDIYRHDFNLHPLWYWRTGEAGDRRGANEIRHVMGLYAYFDALQRDHPGLLLDNSASGGRRLDYEMSRRLVPLLRTDYLWEPVGAQAMTHGLSTWLPLSGQGGVSTANHDFRSGMGSWGSYAFDYYRLEAPFWGPLRAQLSGMAPLSRLFSGDFYPLTPYSTNRADWIAWQFHRADLGEGLVQAFRRDRNPTPAIGLRLSGLEPGATYSVIDLERGVTRVARGRELMDDGVGVRVENAPEAATLHYRRSVE